jgi:hypothetical protein
MHTYTAIVTIPRDQTFTLSFRLRGVIPSRSYRLTVVQQPVAWPDHVHLTVTAKSGRITQATGLTIAGGQAISDLDPNGDLIVEAAFG